MRFLIEKNSQKGENQFVHPKYFSKKSFAFLYVFICVSLFPESLHTSKLDRSNPFMKGIQKYIENIFLKTYVRMKEISSIELVSAFVIKKTFDSYFFFYKFYFIYRYIHISF